MTGKPHIVGISGSLRKGSLNTKLLLNAKEYLPEHYRFTLADISELPHYNQDLEEDMPEAVLKLVELCKSADGFLFSSPEYNWSIPGVLKNALDWLSRQAVGTPLALKPAAIMGGTPGGFGTSRGQLHLREQLFALNLDTVNRPEVLVPQLHLKFDEEGQFTDEMGRKLLEQLMANFVQKVERNKQA
ncbi:NADPH-dependent FMN reductase [Brevibacillus panacihumi]|uniref:NAD(P)H-dependent oxidoreductase n=1 Tax=Brevibacillus panacihumi TaxID=497735 RepID=A0A3M8CP17_9BACL|nr:NADPH-dependent FMN reductase [Brevibacillus panacihumi]RNB77496.1 NAD(P)H-dependent oxidoreductase [Brevibacillus panacihumi]